MEMGQPRRTGPKRRRCWAAGPSGVRCWQSPLPRRSGSSLGCPGCPGWLRTLGLKARLEGLSSGEWRNQCRGQAARVRRGPGLVPSGPEVGVPALPDREGSRQPLLPRVSRNPGLEAEAASWSWANISNSCLKPHRRVASFWRNSEAIKIKWESVFFFYALMPHLSWSFQHQKALFGISSPQRLS